MDDYWGYPYSRNPPYIMIYSSIINPTEASGVSSKQQTMGYHFAFCLMGFPHKHGGRTNHSTRCRKKNVTSGNIYDNVGFSVPTHSRKSGYTLLLVSWQCNRSHSINPLVCYFDIMDSITSLAYGNSRLHQCPSVLSITNLHNLQFTKLTHLAILG